MPASREDKRPHDGPVVAEEPAAKKAKDATPPSAKVDTEAAKAKAAKARVAEAAEAAKARAAKETEAAKARAAEVALAAAKRAATAEADVIEKKAIAAEKKRVAAAKAKAAAEAAEKAQADVAAKARKLEDQVFIAKVIQFKKPTSDKIKDKVVHGIMELGKREIDNLGEFFYERYVCRRFVKKTMQKTKKKYCTVDHV